MVLKNLQSEKIKERRLYNESEKNKSPKAYVIAHSFFNADVNDSACKRRCDFR